MKGPQAAHLRSDRRLAWCLAAAVIAHLMLIAPSFMHWSCTHDRPLGLPGGSGDKIARGTPQGVLGGTGKEGGGQKRQESQSTLVQVRMQHIASAALASQRLHGRRRFMERLSADGLRALLLSRNQGQIEQNPAQEMRSSLDSFGNGLPGPPGPLGLPQGEGSGSTAAGSPFGTRIGAKLWLYRVKYSGGDWDANPQALPALLHEVKLALKLKEVGSEEVIRLSDLPKHRGAFMPSMLFMTGTGGIEASDEEKKNLRDYLLGGGMLVADSSGGSFEQHFMRFIAAVLPGKKARAIEFDNDVFRGRWMPYKLASGCPIYRDHGSNQALGMFDDDGRLMVFFSPGDMGSAWAVVELGRKRGDVEASFQMGTNLVAYSLMTVHDKRK